ncbi:MAG: hypothetical protein HY822_04990 [Acidobacteria bacterium]|nr:hypothetical protein [Acidobacteriota bacterium]
MGLFVLNAVLNLPLFLPGEMPFRGSIGSGYASMARFVAEYPDPWGWNPTQYCGLPTLNTYLPGLIYVAAILDRLLPADAEYMWRLLTATLTCFGPATLYLFVRYFTRSRGWALATALAYMILSPAYGLIRTIDKDRGLLYLPWRMQVFAKYGEGPHNAGLTLLPVTLIAVWVAATGRRYWHIFVCAVLLALTALINWVAALALAWCCLSLLVSGMGAPGFRAWRALAAAGLAYLLSAFWLTPGLIQLIAFNWPTDAFAYKMKGEQVLLLAALPAGLLLLRLVFLRLKEHRYQTFLALALFGFAWVTLNFYWRGHDVIPESRRYAIELEMFLLVLGMELLRQAFARGSGGLTGCTLVLATAMAVAGAPQLWRTFTRGYERWLPVPRERTVEYRLARWLDQQKPKGRVLATGGLRFRLNSWFGVPQTGGTFETGLRNRVPLHWTYQIRTGIGSEEGKDGIEAVYQLKSMGVEYIVVHGPQSEEYYRDIRRATKFDGVLEKVHSDGDNCIYRVPFHSYAHLLRPAELPVHHHPHWLPPYAAAIDGLDRPRLASAWNGPNELRVEGPIPEGMVVIALVNHDPGWRAEQDGQSVPLEATPLGAMLIRARPAARTRITLRYAAGLEPRLMAGVSGLAWLAAVGALFRRRRAG